MLAWEVIDTSYICRLDNLQLATILNGKIDQSLLNYPGLIEERRKKFNEVLKKISVLVLYFRDLKDQNSQRTLHGQLYDYKQLLEKKDLSDLRSYTEGDSSSRSELAKAIRFLRTNKKSAMLMRIDCLFDNISLNERHLLLLFWRRDLFFLETIFYRDVMLERNNRRSNTLKRTLKNQNKTASEAVMRAREKARIKGADANRTKACEMDKKSLDEIIKLREQGLGLSAIAREVLSKVVFWQVRVRWRILLKGQIHNSAAQRWA